MSKIKSLFFFAFLTTTLFLMTGCNTMEGLGKDVKKSGEKLENSASKNKDY